jgi:hypothetical protein
MCISPERDDLARRVFSKVLPALDERRLFSDGFRKA